MNHAVEQLKALQQGTGPVKPHAYKVKGIWSGHSLQHHFLPVPMLSAPKEEKG